MHTYNIKSVTCSEMPPEENAKPVNKIINLLEEGILDERHDQEFYKRLSEMAGDATDRDILWSMHLDEMKHEIYMTEIYKHLTDAPLTAEQPQVEVSSDMLKNFETALFGEISAVSFYRKILFAFADRPTRDTLYEIITDEQRHASFLNYLYAKHKV